MKQKRRGIAFTIITAILLSQVSFALIVQAIGAVLFTNSFKKEYATATYHMANTATSSSLQVKDTRIIRKSRALSIPWMSAYSSRRF